MNTKTFGDACAFEGKTSALAKQTQKLIVVRSDMDASGAWRDPPFDASGGWMSIAKAKKLAKDINRAIAYADKSKVGK